MSITILIIIATVLISIQGFNSPSFLSDWSYSPYKQKHLGDRLRMIKHIFVHVDFGHLFFNMFSLYLFGTMLENGSHYTDGTLYQAGLSQTYGALGYVHFFILYFAGGIAATIWPYVRNQDNDRYFSVGASGSVSAVIFAAIIWSPTMEMGLFFIPVYLPAYIFGPLLLVFEYFSLKRGKSNIAHDAHIGGALFGIFYVLIINFDKGKELINVILN